MPSKITCFWLEPTPLVNVSFRRYRTKTDSVCPLERAPYPGHPPVAWGYHNASVFVGQRERLEGEPSGSIPSFEQQADPRWPKNCGCGYEFTPTDSWQVNAEMLYMASNGTGLFTLHDAPAGAMYDANWYDRKGPDGKSVVVKTPEGEWWIDGYADNGPGWQRTGEVPVITCNPSIAIGTPQRLHGWLRNGVLEIDFP